MIIRKVVFLLENESNCCSRCAYLRAGAVTAGAADGGECSLEQFGTGLLILLLAENATSSSCAETVLEVPKCTQISSCRSMIRTD